MKYVHTDDPQILGEKSTKFCSHGDVTPEICLPLS